MLYKRCVLLLLALCLPGSFLAAQEAAIYRYNLIKGEYTLYIPGITFDDTRIGNAWLDWDGDKGFVINRYATMDDEDSAIFDFLARTACSPADNLEKVAAYLAYRDGSSDYCINIATNNTLEGGSYSTYALIEDQVVRYVEDVRDDGFASCCFNVVDGPGTMQLGIYENDNFVAVDIVSQVDLNKDYVIRIPDAGGYFYEF